MKSFVSPSASSENCPTARFGSFPSLNHCAVPTWRIDSNTTFQDIQWVSLADDWNEGVMPSPHSRSISKKKVREEIDQKAKAVMDAERNLLRQKVEESHQFLSFDLNAKEFPARVEANFNELCQFNQGVRGESGWILTRSATIGALGLTKERSDFPSLSAAFRCISRCEGGSEERKNRVGSKCWGVALRVGIQGGRCPGHL